MAIPGPYTWLFAIRYKERYIERYKYDIKTDIRYTIFLNRRTTCWTVGVAARAFPSVPVCLPLLRYCIQQVSHKHCTRTLHSESYKQSADAYRARRGYPWDTDGDSPLVSVHWFAAYKWCIAILTLTLCPPPTVSGERLRLNLQLGFN